MKPLTRRQLLGRLISDPCGQIVLWNFIDSHDEGLLTPKEIQEFFNWWCAVVPIIEASPSSPLTVSDTVFMALDLLRLERSHWEKLELTYPGLVGIGPKPEFRSLCHRAIRPRRANSTLSTTINTESFFRFLAADVKNEMLGRGVLDTTSDGVIVRANIGGQPKRARADRLKDDAHLGVPGGLVWYTRSPEVEEFVVCRDADGICDFLGLAHIGEDVDMVSVEFKTSATSCHRSGRPTAIDAGTNSRFKARAHLAVNRSKKAWGFTTDLMKLEQGKKRCDGAQERVAYPIPASALRQVDVKPAGRTAVVRGSARPPGDGGFANLLAGGQDKRELRRRILALL